MTDNSPQLSDRSSAVLWATPSWGDAPERLLHVKTTAKQIQVRSKEGLQWTERYARERNLPDGALGSKDGMTFNSRRFLFADRATCLRFMAERAREQAQRAEEKAAQLRAWADARDAESRAAFDEEGRSDV